MLERRKPLVSRTPLRAKDYWRPARKRLPAQSKRRRKEAPIRKSLREETIELAGGLCQAQGFYGHYCHTSDVYDWEGNPVGEVHEVIRRGRRPGAHLDVSLTLFLCHQHHTLVGDHEPESRDAGLAFRSHEVEDARRSVQALREGRQPK